MEYCIINCTTQTKEDAVLIAKELTKKHLIACATIVPSVTSVYFWDNKLNEDSEALMIIKTKTELYEKVEEEIKKLHKYETPEIICTPIISGSSEYLNWIEKQTK